jgi:VIT1/CCC1 family predicted Fe2+/Mn2+ transporter
VMAALTSAGTFVVGAGLPLVTALLAPAASVTSVVAIASLIFLAALGAIGATAGGAGVWRGMARVMFWGALAMAVTYAIGSLLGTTVA